MVEKLFREFEKNVFPTKCQGQKFMDGYLKKVNLFDISIIQIKLIVGKVAIVRKSYQGGQSLEVSLISFTNLRLLVTIQITFRVISAGGF